MFCFQGMHNFQLGETSHLRVSFSKSTITPPVAPLPCGSVNPAVVDVGAMSLPPANILVAGGVEQLSSPHVA